MGIAIIVMILVIIVLYLIVLSSDKARKLKQEEMSLITKLIENSELKDKYSEQLARMSTSKLFLIVKLLILKRENKRLKDINAELRDEHNDYVVLKYDYEKVLRSTIIDLLDIQDISNLGISEEEKNKNRNVIINKIIKDFSKKINELENSSKSI